MGTQLRKKAFSSASSLTIPEGVYAKIPLFGNLSILKANGAITAILWGDSNDQCISSCDNNLDWLKAFAPTLDRRLCRVAGLHPSDRPSYQAVWVPAAMAVGATYAVTPTASSPYANIASWSASGFAFVAGPVPGYGGSPSSCYAITTANSGVRYLRYVLDQRNSTTNPPVWARNKAKFCVSLWFGARDTDTPISVTASTASTFAASPASTPASDVNGYSPATINVQVLDGSAVLKSGSTQAIDTRLPHGNAWQTLTGVFTAWNSYLYGPSGTSSQYIEIQVPDTANSMGALGGILLDDGTAGGVRIIDLSYSGGSFAGRALEDRDNTGASTNNAYAGMGRRWMPAIGSWIGEDWADRVEAFWTRLVNPATGASRKATFQAAGIVQNVPYATIDAMFINLFTNDYNNSTDNLAKFLARATEVVTRGLAKNPNMLFFFAIRPTGGDSVGNRDDPATNASYTHAGTVKGLRSTWFDAIKTLVDAYPANVVVLDAVALFQGQKPTDLVRYQQLFGTSSGTDLVNFDPLHVKPRVNELIADVWGRMFDAA